MTKRTVVALVAMAIGLLAGGTTWRPAAVLAQAKPVVWNLPHVAAPTYYHVQNLNMLGAKVKEKSQGRMEIRVHPASSLYPSHEIIPAVIEGRVEIAPVISGVRGAFGRSGTSSIHLPEASVLYVASLFAFQSAFVSVVSVKQPTETSLRIAHGRTAIAQAPTARLGTTQSRRSQPT